MEKKLFLQFHIGSYVKLFSVVEATQGQRKMSRSNLIRLALFKYSVLCLV
jgi:hypothetical protein